MKKPFEGRAGMVHKMGTVPFIFIGTVPYFVRVKPETEQLLTRWGKSCVFYESTGLSLYILAVRLRRIPSKSN
ncbi:MAG: hypothetical protein HQ555_05275 [Candidatus Aminicenantes bacterium]|nr:hypothetical protein [Candidatus Aminicenantes bacterium]